MAEAIVSSLVRDLLGRLTSAAIQELRLLRGFKDDLLALEGYFKGIQDVLLDAEFQKNRRTDQNAFESWLKDLRSELVKMENLLDEVSTEAMLRNLPIKYKVRAFFSSYHHNQFTFRFRIAHQVKAIRKNIADIAARRFQLSFTPGAITVVSDKEVESEMPNMETSSVLVSSVIYGRNEEMEMVVKKICNPDICKNDIPVFAIWGMGGLGKTTLAQLVYNHIRVDEYFELKCWMYVSEKFQVKEFIRRIINSIDKSSDCTLSELDDLQLDLQKRLRGKRFLIVLDDVWIEEKEKNKWEQLSSTLSCGAKGSIVLLTTRTKTTSRMMAKDAELQHELGCLSEEDSWSLFEKLAFAQGRERGERREELEPIGKEIVKRCKGLPLAVKTLGGLMWSKSSRDEWERVQSSDIWELQENDEILPALKLSYDNLLPHIKRCFAYCCLFPKGYKMKKSSLIDLWMSNGLIPTGGGEANWYVLGEKIINCLLWKSCFQLVVDHDFSSPIRRFFWGVKLEDRYVMHDLMHDLAQYVMRYDYWVIEPGKLIIPDEVLVLHLSRSSCPHSPQDYIEKLKPLRSLFIFSHAFDTSTTTWLDLIKHMLYLRVLYLVGIYRWTFPESIYKLKHLRYLNLSNSKIVVLPESIVYLQNLQVLIVDGCENLSTLPKGMRYMRNLQHLHNYDCIKLSHMPVGMKELTGLRRISEFVVSELKNRGAQIGELGGLNQLGGDMILSGLEDVGSLEEAMSANMKRKKEISSLDLVWKWRYGVRLLDEEVLEGLEPNQSLKVLKIVRYMGSSISPSWMENLKNLVEIAFAGCGECKYIPPLGKFPSLRVIILAFMRSLKSFHDDDNITSGDNILFPSLQELCIKACPFFVSLPNNIGNLKKLVIDSCESLRSLPEEIQSFKNLKQFEIYYSKSLYERYNKETGVDWPKISHIPDVRIEEETSVSILVDLQ